MSKSNSFTKMILLAGFLAGTLDAIAAMIVYKAMPIPIFKFIASGAFGKAAFTGGLDMALWGLVFHYVISYSWTVLFFILYPRIKFLSKNIILSGLGYGIVIWIVMNRVILPLTLVTRGPFAWKGAIIGTVILMLMVGLPIAILAHRYYRPQHGKDRAVA
jgi:hypothetical protein